MSVTIDTSQTCTSRSRHVSHSWTRTDCNRIFVQILEVQQRIAAGEHFATVAGEMSEDKARQGGDLGWKGRQEVVGAFAEAAFKLEVCVLDR